MTTLTNTNKHNIKIGDVITFTNPLGCKVVLNITRVEEKSIYDDGFRQAWTTVNNYIDNHNAKIIRK